MSGITGFFHGGITVRDMDRSLEFYESGLGLTVEFDRLAASPYLKEVLGLEFEELRIVYLRIPNAPGSFVELLEYRGLERHSAAARPCDYGSGHLCLLVDDVVGVHARMLGLGFTSRSPQTVAITAGPNAGARSVYLIDPDQYLIELFQPAPRD
ncbi:MAG: VOC family protein [Chloroflexi bacterium]|nr:VOC family protein [Chloroflexota bacterium]